MPVQVQDVQQNDHQESDTYKKAYRENLARLEAEKAFKAENAEVLVDQIPLGQPQSRYFDAANRF